MSSKPIALFTLLLSAAALIWSPEAPAQLDRLKNAAERVGGLVDSDEETSSGNTAGQSDEASSAGSESATADAERIIALHAEHGNVLDTIHGNSVVYYDNPDAAREGLDKIEAAEAAAAEIRPLMQVVAERYGRERGAITEAMDAAGVSVDKANYMVAANAHDLFEFLEQLAKAR